MRSVQVHGPTFALYPTYKSPTDTDRRSNLGLQLWNLMETIHRPDVQGNAFWKNG